MLEASSHGRAAPRTKSINVEANLLAERLAERQCVRHANSLRLGGITVAILVGVTIFPPLARWEGARMAAAKKVEAQKVAIGKTLSQLQAMQASAKPKLADQQLSSKLQKEADYYVAAVTEFLNSATPGMVFDSLKVSLDSGQVQMAAKADAESYAAVREFFAKASLGHEKETMITSNHRSQLLGPEGITFDLERKVAVAQ